MAEGCGPSEMERLLLFFFFFSFFSFWWWHLREFLVWVTNWSAVLIWREEQKHAGEKKVKMLCANHEMVGKRIIDERNSWYYHHHDHLSCARETFLSSHALCFSRPFFCSITQQHCSLSLSFSISFSILIFLYSFLKLFSSSCAFVWFHRLFVGMAYSQPRHTHTHQFGKCRSFIPISSTERRRIIKSHTRATLFMISNWLERAAEAENDTRMSWEMSRRISFDCLVCNFVVAQGFAFPAVEIIQSNILSLVVERTF